MHIIDLRKGQRLAGEAAQPLAERTIPTFHMIDFAAVFADLLMGFSR
jgi:hypothetical protein